MNFRLWRRQVSHPMQEELYRRARLLQANIIQAECERLCPIEIVEERSRRVILLRDAHDGKLLDLLPYKISRIGLFFRNLRRYARFTFFAGGGRDSRNVLPISTIEYLVLRHLWLRQFLTFAILRRSYGAFRNQVRVVGSHFRSGIRLFGARIGLCIGTCVSRIWSPVLSGARALQRLVRKTVVLSRSAVRSLREWHPVGRVVANALRSLAIVGISLGRGLGATVYWVGRRLRAVLGALYRAIRGNRQPKPQRARRSIFSTAALRLHGNRLSLALMDRDWRWLSIAEVDRRRIIAIRDPWFDSTANPVNQTEDEFVVAKPHDPEIQETWPASAQPSHEIDRKRIA